MQLSSLIRYPLKSCRAESLDRSEVGLRGLEHDRRWMVVDAEGQFITARKTPALLSVIVQASTGGTLQLKTEGHGACEAVVPNAAQTITSTVWGDACEATHVSGADAWLSTLLDQPARLVYMPESLRRPVDPEFAEAGDIVSFADGFPLLVANQSSLDDLNTRLKNAIPMARFRPNLIVEGAKPYDEYNWRRIRVGDLELSYGGPCVRCVMTTRDPETGDTDGSGEPLKTLNTYQRNDSGPIFGVNFIPRSAGTLMVGQTVEILERA